MPQYGLAYLSSILEELQEFSLVLLHKLLHRWSLTQCRQGGSVVYCWLTFSYKLKHVGVSNSRRKGKFTGLLIRHEVVREGCASDLCDYGSHLAVGDAVRRWNKLLPNALAWILQRLCKQQTC